MNNYDIVKLETWDKESITIKMNIEDWLNLKTKIKSKGEDGVYVKDLKRFIKFSNIKDEQGKTHYISLPVPKKEFIELTISERQARDKMLSDMLSNTYEARKKTFIENRKEILKQLAKTEIRFNFQTTIEKLEELSNRLG